MERETAALLERADALRRAGRAEEAIAAYEQLLEREPAHPDSWYNLGWCQKQARRFEDALESYAEALRRGVHGPEEVRLNRAVILSDHLARPDLAEVELEAALTAEPNYLPALLNLGNLYEDLGRREEAEVTYRRALDVAPGDSLALSRLGGVVAAGSPAGEELIERLGQAIATQSGAAERADLGFALGRLFDGQGKYAEAFDAYSAANTASRESFGPVYPGYSRGGAEAAIDRLVAAFSTPAANGSDDVAAPVFICGLFRSGSTLVEQILASHSRVVSGGELDLVPALAARISGYPESVAGAGQAAVNEWRRFYLDGLRPFARDGALATDKRPDNFLHLGFIKTLFPHAKIVHTRRNRLDNLLSLYFLHLGPAMPYALDLADAAHWHGQYERLMDHWKSLYPDDIVDMDYDALVREPKPAVERLLGFLGLDWEEGLLDFHRRSGPVKTASVWQVREPLHARSSGRWRNYSDQLKSALGESFADE